MLVGPFVTETFAQAGPHAGMGRPSTMTRPARPEKMRHGPPTPKKGPEERLEKLEQMSAEERRLALQNLPVDRQRKIESKLEDYKRLSPDAREQLHDRLHRFESLPVERQNRIRQLATQFGELPDSRRRTVRDELDMLRVMPETERRSRLNSAEFRNRFTASERQMLQDASSVLPTSDQF